MYTILLFAVFFFGCSTSQKLDTKTVYYDKFDIFKLSGIDTLTVSDLKARNNSEFVKVLYTDDNLPNEVNYHFADREVVLKLESTFKFLDRNIYVFYTGNLLGGKAGKQREYSMRYIDNAYRLYVDLSDTLLVKSYDNIDTKSSERYHYMVDVYTKKEKQFGKYSLLQADTNKSVSEDSLYKSWNKELQILKPVVISDFALFPPK